MGGEPETRGNNNALSKKPSYDDEGWSKFIWNNRTKQFFGRTGASWFKIFIFYVIFYAALAAFSWLCYYLFATLTLTEDQPRWTLGSSIIGTNPGVGFRPMPDQEKNPGSSVIWYRRDNDADAKIWYGQLTNYTEEIDNPAEKDSLQVCTYDNGVRANKWKSCRVDLKEFGSACSRENNFGYTEGEPCFLIKLNRIFSWRPEPYGIDQSTGKYDAKILEDDLEEQKEMPDWLREHIQDGVKKASNATSFLDTVWVSCAGENIADQENIGTINYFPLPGIPGYFYPYAKQLGYQSPFIFVQFLKPKTKILINIECRAWAKNIVYEKANRLGSVHFELMID